MNPEYGRLYLTSEVRQALDTRLAIVALESTVITHGLPYPENLELAIDMEAEIRQQQAVPATVAVLDGKVHIGLDPAQLERLAKGVNLHKISVRDFGPAAISGLSGGTTVAGTLVVAQRAGLKVFATGGIGGVHRGEPFDISTDLTLLRITPMIVVCAGAKAVLDLPATLEVLETYGIPVLGYQTDEFPAFYSYSSGLPVSCQADSPEQAAKIAQAHWANGSSSAVLVCVPPPVEAALPPDVISLAIEQALAEAQAKNIRGQRVTPFLLSRVSELTHGASLQANLALLRNNARLAGMIAAYFR